MFGYWTSFLPDTTGIGGPPHGQNLFTAIMKDPSPKASFLAHQHSIYFNIFTPWLHIIPYLTGPLFWHKGPLVGDWLTSRYVRILNFNLCIKKDGWTQ